MSGHRWPIGLGIVAVVTAPAFAQDLTQGKTAAQLFAGDCAACHKSPQGLARGGDARSVASFLGEHYTTKPEMAQALASYLVASGGSARGQPSPAERGRASVTNEPIRGLDSLRPRLSIPLLGGDEPPPAPGAVPAEPADNSKPAKPRAASISSESKPDSEARRPRSGDASKPADEKDKLRASRGTDAKRNGEDDAAADAARAKPRASRTDEGRKPGDAGAPGRLNSYARPGSSDKDNATESPESRAGKLHSYATSGEPAPAVVAAPPKAVANPPAEPATTSESVTPSASVTPANVSNPTDDAIAAKVESGDTGDEAPSATKPRKPASGDAAKPPDGAAAKRPHRADANAPQPQPQSPMSFFGRILSGGARTRGSETSN